MGRYIYDNLTDHLKKSIEKYYENILIDNKGISNTSSVYSYIDCEELVYITQDEKTTKLRDLNIDMLIDDSCDVDGIKSEIYEVENMNVITESNMGEISMVIKNKQLQKYRIDIEVPSISIEYEYVESIFGIIIRKINDHLFEMIKDVEVVHVNNLRELYMTEHGTFSKNRIGIDRLGTSSFTFNDCNFKNLNIGVFDRYIITTKGKPIVFSIDSVLCVQNNNPMDFKTSYKIRVSGCLDIITDIKDCKIINLTDNFFKSII